MTLSGNDGDGLSVSTYSTATVNNSTITDNGAYGIYISHYAGLYIYNSIVIGNHGGGDLQTSSPAGVSYVAPSSSNNIVGIDLDAKLNPATNLIDVNPSEVNLSPLGNYGGHTRTHALLADSIAINRGDQSLLPAGMTTDQRGQPRVLGGQVDVGAHEASPIVEIEGPSIANPNTPYNWSFHAGGSLLGSTQNVVIDWHDGTATQTVTLGSTVPHSFADRGLHRITATVVDPDGITTIARANVSVGLVPYWFEETGGSDTGLASAHPEYDAESHLQEIPNC